MTYTKEQLELAQKVADTLLKNSKILKESWDRYQKATDNLIKKMIERENEPPKRVHHAMIVKDKIGKVVHIGVNERGMDADFLQVIKELHDYAKKKGGRLYVEYK